MRILSKYVLREFLTPVVYCFVAFAALHLVFEIFGEVDKILAAKPPASLLLRYIAGFLTKDLQWLVTPSLMLGGLYSMWQLARHSEITAMRANGISFSSITAPILCVSAIVGALVFVCGEFYAPDAIYDSALIKESGFKSGARKLIPDMHFNNVADRRDWNAAIFDCQDQKLTDVKITWTDDAGHIVQVLAAPTAAYVDDAWIFQDASMTKFVFQPGAAAQVASDRAERPLLVMPELVETPRDFVIEQNQQGVNPETASLSVRDMMRYVKMRPNLQGTVRRTWTYEIANRFAAPLACIFITLFAIPAGVATGRQSVFAGVVTAIVLFIGYYAFSLFCGVQAKGGAIPIWLGLALPNITIFIAGMYLFRRQR